MNAPPLLELCIASLDDALAAAQVGADRVELNSAMELGGLTPSPGLTCAVVEAIGSTSTSVIAMIRPRPGGFCYSQADLRVMHRDIAQALEMGVDGVALGVLTDQGEIDGDRCASLIEPVLAAGKTAVCHRAFDLSADMIGALDCLIQVGFDRVLTSGGAPSALEGQPMLKRLIEHAQEQIEILPAGGIRPGNVAAILANTGCTQAHASLRTVRSDRSTRHNPALRFGVANLPPESQYGATDARLAGELIRAMRSTGLA